ncbi:hypothetical protein GcC1_141013 [Golovinomyces cichoracearum]|uniref:Uncharacterized protein n=1 Tax=Golovinomyces cichoracearum TaxID=62708 RepID=A0A420I0G2_9PEZI|nr:hypothetical protein GcC1_141013 [Golovinomyces cichoracearum]
MVGLLDRSFAHEKVLRRHGEWRRAVPVFIFEFAACHGRRANGTVMLVDLAVKGNLARSHCLQVPSSSPGVQELGGTDIVDANSPTSDGLVWVSDPLMHHKNREQRISHFTIFNNGAKDPVLMTRAFETGLTSTTRMLAWYPILTHL